MTFGVIDCSQSVIRQIQTMLTFFRVKSLKTFKSINVADLKLD